MECRKHTPSIYDKWLYKEGLYEAYDNDDNHKPQQKRDRTFIFFQNIEGDEQPAPEWKDHRKEEKNNDDCDEPEDSKRDWICRDIRKRTE